MNWSINSYAPSSHRDSNEPEWHQPSFTFAIEATWNRHVVPLITESYASTLLSLTTASEYHSPSLLAQPDVEPVAQRQTQWDDLSAGVQWAVLKILCENEVPGNHGQKPRPFSSVVSVVLRLKRRQIQSFLTVYVDEYEAWQKFGKRAASINWAEIIRLASEREMPLHHLLPKNRPRLSTDSISREAVDLGVSFLRAAGLEAFAANLREWIGINLYGDFIGLAVEAEILRDYLDGKTIRKAVILGWINLEDIGRNLKKQREEHGIPTQRQATGIFSDDFEGDPYPSHYYAKEWKKLGVDPRKAINAKALPKACANDATSGPPGHEKTRPMVRPPTEEEKMETRAAVGRMIVLPDGVRRGVNANNLQPVSAANTSSAYVQSANGAAGRRARSKTPRLATPELSVIEEERTNTTEKDSSHGFQRASSNSNDVVHVTPSLRSVTPRPRSSSQQFGNRGGITPIDNRAERFQAIAEQTPRKAVNKKKRELGHSKSTFAPLGGVSATPDSIPPHQQLRATAIANHYNQSPSESPLELAAIQNTIKRSRKPSRRLRDNLESESEWVPDSDENPQPKKKPRKTAVKRAATGPRHFQLDGAVSATPSPQLRLQEVRMCLQPKPDADVYD